jgi:hypothetical protein
MRFDPARGKSLNSNAMKPRTDLGSLAGMLLMAIIILMAIASIYLHPAKESDFLGIYDAASAHAHGQDPYNVAAISPDTNDRVMPYIYPPYTLYFFRPFTWLEFDAAARLFLTLKLLAIAGLLYLWLRVFGINEYRGLFYFLVPLAFSGALIADLRAGNISIFEQLLLWAGFYFYTREKPLIFGIAVVVVALFKLTPILLLGLLLAKGKKKELTGGVVLGAVFIGLLVASTFIWPDLFASSMKNARGLMGEHNESNPSTLALVSDATHWFQTKLHLTLPRLIPLGIYAILAAGALAVSVMLFWQLRRMESRQGDLWRICLLCFTYAIVVPRLKDYSYLLLVAPAFFLLSSCKWMNPLLPFSGLLLIYSYGNVQYFGTALAPFYHVQREYYCLLLAWMLWALCCYSVWRETRLTPHER